MKLDGSHDGLRAELLAFDRGVPTGPQRGLLRVGGDTDIMNMFNDLKIEKKLMAAFAVVIVAIAAMGATVFFEINAMEKARFERVRAAAVQRGDHPPDPSRKPAACLPVVA